jgi:hypothetical protein
LRQQEVNVGGEAHLIKQIALLEAEAEAGVIAGGEVPAAEKATTTAEGDITGSGLIVLPAWLD